MEESEASKDRVAQITHGLIILLMLGLLTSAFITTPDTLGPFGITLWFVGLFLTLSGVFAVVINVIKKLWTKRPQVISSSFGQGTLLAGWLSLILALNSLNQLSLKDIVLITVLLLLIEFYLRRKS